MTQAAFELQSTDKRVLDISLKYGYTSPTSFNRAFQNVYGLSPAAAKNKGNILNAYPPMKFSVNITGESAMPYRIEESSPFRIVGIRIPLTEDMEHNQEIVPLFWEKTLHSKYFNFICALSNQSPKRILGVTVYQNKEEIFYFIAAATDRAVPKDLFAYQIPAATWVVFENKEPFKESIRCIFRRFLTEWLPFSGYTYAELPDIEIYPLEAYSQNSYSEVWIAIKKNVLFPNKEG